jgi:hypothetical protein
MGRSHLLMAQYRFQQLATNWLKFARCEMPRRHSGSDWDHLTLYSPVQMRLVGGFAAGIISLVKADLIARVEGFAVIREVWASTGRVGHDTVAHDRVRRHRQHGVVCNRGPRVQRVTFRSGGLPRRFFRYAHAEYRLP